MRLILITVQFPFGGEIFLKYELPVLSSFFDEIKIIPISKCKGNIEFDLPKNVKINIFKKLCNFYGQHFLMTKTFNLIISEAKRARNLVAFAKILYRYVKSVLLYKELLKEGLDENTVYYSYWLNAGALSLAMIKDKFPNIKAISRAHGSDIFEEYSEGKLNPFVQYVIDKLDMIFSVSNRGKIYLEKRYGHSEKILISRLGTPDPGVLNKPSNDGVLRIVSCSRIIKVKRVDLIVKAISKIRNLKVNWIHFGGGKLQKRVIRLAKKLLDSKPNISWQIKGDVPNDEIHKHYSSKSVDIFINVSLSEGIPVSIMEAMSYGIPVVATDVGGNSEIVNNDVGILLDQDPKIEDISNAIVEVFRRNIDRRMIKRHWRDLYSLRNYISFAETLVNLGSGR